MNGDLLLDHIHIHTIILQEKEAQKLIQPGKTELKRVIDDSIKIVENDELEDELKESVINLWEDIESKFNVERKKKKR